MEVSVRIFYPEPPAYAELAPELAVYVGDASGRCEVFAWEVARGIRHQLTERPQGTVTCAIDPSGNQVWWFDDDLSGFGVWRVQPFAGGDARPSGIPAGRDAGLAMALDDTVAAGVGDARGTTVYLVRPGKAARQVARAEGYARLVDLSASADLLALSTEPDADDAVTVISLVTRTRTVLSGARRSLWATGFAPGTGSGARSKSGSESESGSESKSGSESESESAAGPGPDHSPEKLLLTTQVAGGYRLATWTATEGLVEHDWCTFDTEISPSWYPDGNRVLVRQDRHARSILHTVDLHARTVEVLDTPRGSILASAAQPDGDLHYVWTDSVQQPRLHTSSGRRPPEPAPDQAPPAVLREVWVPTPAGDVHALLTLPDSPGPHPAVFLLHGGPHDAARDAYDPLVSVFVSIGCAVVRPNYRGSIGYGAGWRERFEDGVGLTQLDDLAAVRAHLVAAGLVDPRRSAVTGQSWGGYLALLAAGVQPELWRAVAAVNPIADYPAAFQQTTEAVRSLDVRLFGGTPKQLPAQYARSSPATYAAAVRAPVLVVAGTDDPKCPPGQIRGYADALRRHGQHPTLEWTESGHEGHGADIHVRTLATVVSFVGTAMGGRPAPSPAGAG